MTHTNDCPVTLGHGRDCRCQSPRTANVQMDGYTSDLAPTGGAEAAPTDSQRLDWLEKAMAKGRVFSLSWYGRQKSTIEESIQYDIPAGFYTGEDDGPYVTLRAAIDAAIAAADTR